MGSWRCVLALLLCWGVWAQADFFQDPLFVGQTDPILEANDENFLSHRAFKGGANDDFMDVAWLQKRIDAEIALNPSLVRGFLAVAEGRRTPVARHWPSILPAYQRERLSVRQFVDHMAKLAGQTLRELDRRSRAEVPLVQLLISDQGVTGVSHLLHSYARHSHRPLIEIGAKATYDTLSLAERLHSAYVDGLRTGHAPILVVEKLNQQPPVLQQILWFLATHRQLLGTGTLVLTADVAHGLLPGQLQMGDEFFYRLRMSPSWAEVIDAIHVVRSPASAHHYENLIWRWLNEENPSATAGQNSLSEPVRTLAQAAFDLQLMSKRSVIAELGLVLKRRTKCARQFQWHSARDDERVIRFYKAARTLNAQRRELISSESPESRQPGLLAQPNAFELLAE